MAIVATVSEAIFSQEKLNLAPWRSSRDFRLPWASGLVLISAGATPKALQQVLGHGSAAFSLTAYGHIFDADLDELAERLDSISGAAQTRPKPVHFLEVDAHK
jgi:hypothetical protein